jgi:hypothetical protein
MDDDVAVVHQDPSAGLRSLETVQSVPSLIKNLFDLVFDGQNLAF